MIYNILIYHTIPYNTIPYHRIPYHTLPYHTIHTHIYIYRYYFFYIILYHATVTLYHTASYFAWPTLWSFATYNNHVVSYLRPMFALCCWQSLGISTAHDTTSVSICFHDIPQSKGIKEPGSGHLPHCALPLQNAERRVGQCVSHSVKFSEAAGSETYFMYTHVYIHLYPFVPSNFKYIELLFFMLLNTESNSKRIDMRLSCWASSDNLCKDKAWEARSGRDRACPNAIAPRGIK